MKMAAVSTVTALLLCCSFFASADSTDSCSHYAVTNGVFTVPLNHNLQTTERLIWKFSSTIIYDSRTNKEKKNVLVNGSISLTKVSKANEGLYTPEVYTSNGKAVQNLKAIRLCVIDPVLKPKVIITCPASSSVHVACNVKVKKDIQVEWFQNGKQLVKEKGKWNLQFNAETVETDSFTCVVSNKASSSKSDPAVQDCFTPGFTFPEELFGFNIWIFVGGGAGVVVLLILIVIICCIHNRRRKRVQLKDEEELRLGWTNPNQQQHQHHHHQHQHNHPPNQHQHHQHQHQQQQQPAGHTGPRQHRKKQQQNPRPRAPEPNGQPEPSPRRQGLSLPKVPDSTDDEQPPPLPQPRKKGPKTQRV